MSVEEEIEEKTKNIQEIMVENSGLIKYTKCMHSRSLINSKNNKCKQNNETYYNQTVKRLKRNPKSKRRETIHQYKGPSKDDELIF